jgi:hypothetical protein
MWGHTLRVPPTFYQFLIVRTDQDQPGSGISFPRLRSQIGRRALFVDKTTARTVTGYVRGGQKDRALECATYTDQRPGQRKRRARWNAEDLHPNSQRSRQRNGARAGMLKTYTRARVKETVRALEC